MEKKKLQISVIAHTSIVKDALAVECKLSINDTACKFFITPDNYERLIECGFFVRDGKTADSAGVINTTSVYVER